MLRKFDMISNSDWKKKEYEALFNKYLSQQILTPGEIVKIFRYDDKVDKVSAPADGGGSAYARKQ